MPGHTYAKLLRKQPNALDRPKLKSRGGRWAFRLVFRHPGHARQMGRCGPSHDPERPALRRPAEGHLHARATWPRTCRLYLHRPSLTDPSVRARGRRYVLCAVTGAESARPGQPSTGRGRARFIAEGSPVLEETDPRFRGQDLSASTLLHARNLRDPLPQPPWRGLFLEPRIFQSAWFRPHNISGRGRGLFLVGAGTHPGAGVPSVVTSSEVLTKLVPDAPRPSPDDTERLAAE
jgi:phytoene desaturase